MNQDQKGSLLLRKSIDKKNIEQTEQILREIVLRNSKKKSLKKSRMRQISLITICLFTITISYNLFTRKHFKLNNFKNIPTDQSTIKVINKHDYMIVRLEDGIWIKINKNDGSYKQVFIDSTIVSE